MLEAVASAALEEVSESLASVLVLELEEQSILRVYLPTAGCGPAHKRVLASGH